MTAEVASLISLVVSWGLLAITFKLKDFFFIVREINDDDDDDDDDDDVKTIYKDLKTIYKDIKITTPN